MNYNLMGVINQVWRKFPELRLGQLLVNAREVKYHDADLFYMSDDDLIKALQEYAEKFTEKNI